MGGGYLQRDRNRVADRPVGTTSFTDSAGSSVLPHAVAYASPATPTNLDAVTSLSPKDLALGQVVPFELEIVVSGSTAPGNGVIQFTPYWSTKTTSGNNFGYDPAHQVYAAFVDTSDPGTYDPDSNAKVDSYTSTVVNPGTSNEQIQGTFQVSGLDNGDKVIVEIWVVLKSTIAPGTTGNVQTGLADAQTATGNKINTGNQTVPLLQVGKFFTNEADVSVTKSGNPDPVVSGQTLTYTITATNHSTDTVANGVVITDTLDPNVTFVSASDGGTAAAGIVTWPAVPLAPGSSVTRTVTVTVDEGSPTENFAGTSADRRAGATAFTGFDIQNRVDITAITSDPTPGNNTYYVPTNVLPGTADVSVSKTDSVDTIYLDGSRALSYTVVVTNTSTTATAKNVVVTDTLDPNVAFVSASPSGSHSAGLVTITVGDLAPGASATYTISVEVLSTAPTTGTGGIGGSFTPPTPPSRTGYDLFNMVIISSDNDSNLANNGYY